MTKESEIGMEEMVDKTAMAVAYCRMFDTLTVLSQFIGMVFDENKTKSGQLELIKSSFEEQTKEKKAMLEEYPEAAGDIAAISLVQDFVDKAFAFSTYSSSRRKGFIRSSITKELKGMEDSVNNLKKLLDTLFDKEEKDD